MKKTTESVSCAKCPAECCRYVATEIGKPTCKRDYDHIRWYLLHKNVNVFVDHDGDWCIEFETDCGNLTKGNCCAGYSDRPHVCRHHGEDGDHCEFHGSEAPYSLHFSTASQFEDYLEKRGIKWRYKQHSTTIIHK